MKYNLLGRIITTIFILGFVFLTSWQTDKQPTAYSVQKQKDQWILLKNGEPFYIKGVAAGEYYDKLKFCGGNSVRFFGNFANNLDSAQKYGLTALFNLPLKGERNGMDFENSIQVAKEKERILDTVRKYMDHPALMLWSVGNELDYIPNADYNRKLWDVINELAGKIHKIDPAHPVLTVVGSGGFENNMKKIQEIARQCPNLDLLGINSYGDIEEYIQLVHQYWPKPYVVTEFGPIGDWQTPRTKWDVPIEQNSSEKAQSYKKHYKIIRTDTSKCLGSYAFSWLQYQLITQTWYGMIDKNGLESEAVEVMHYMWTGTESPNHAPRIDSLYIGTPLSKDGPYLHAGTVYDAHLLCNDPDKDDLEYKWDLLPEVIHGPGYFRETPTEAISEMILIQGQSHINFRTPEKSGAYRLFVKILDHHGHFSGGNIPFYVLSD